MKGWWQNQRKLNYFFHGLRSSNDQTSDHLENTLSDHYQHRLDLPVEILSKIFSFVDYDYDLFSLLPVSRRFASVAVERLWKEPDLWDSKKLARMISLWEKSECFQIRRPLDDNGHNSDQQSSSSFSTTSNIYPVTSSSVQYTENTRSLLFPYPFFIETVWATQTDAHSTNLFLKLLSFSPNIKHFKIMKMYRLKDDYFIRCIVPLLPNLVSLTINSPGLSEASIGNMSYYKIMNVI